MAHKSIQEIQDYIKSKHKKEINSPVGSHYHLATEYDKGYNKALKDVLNFIKSN